MKEGRIAILGYHKIGEPAPGGWETWYYVPEPVFEAQLAAIRRSGWSPIDLDELLRGLDDPESLPQRAVLVTFDDGYRSMLRCALPLLQRARIASVLFVPTAYIGAINTWDLDEEPEEPICTWDDLRSLDAGGMSVQSHSVSHPFFSNLTPKMRRLELAQSKATLEAGLGKRVEAFAFPYGDAGTDASGMGEALSALGYRAAFLYGADEKSRPLSLPLADRYRIDRIAMGPETDLEAVLEWV